MYAGLDMYYPDPEEHLLTAGEGVDDLDRDLSVRCEWLGPCRLLVTLAVGEQLTTTWPETTTR